jgi:hypothetical protein
VERNRRILARRQQDDLEDLRWLRHSNFPHRWRDWLNVARFYRWRRKDGKCDIPLMPKWLNGFPLRELRVTSGKWSYEIFRMPQSRDVPLLLMNPAGANKFPTALPSRHRPTTTRR